MNRQTFFTAVYASRPAWVQMPELDFVLGCCCWAWAEDSGGSNTIAGAGATWNPLDMEERTPTSTPFNTAGVQNYASVTVAIATLWQQIANGNFPGIVGALSSPSSTATRLAAAVSVSRWGTSPFTVARTITSVYQPLVAGSPGPLPPTLPPLPKGLDIMGVTIATELVAVDGVSSGHKFLFTVPVAERATAKSWSVMDLTDVAAEQGVADAAAFTS